MRKYFVIIATALILSACSSEKKKENKTQNSPTMQEYSNEYFSLMYPSNWEYDEEITNMDDTIPVVTKGVRSTFYDSNPYHPWHTVMVQKSAMFEFFETPEEWRNLSVQLKQYDNQYIGTVDAYMQDSISFRSYPAAMAGFVIALESGDTLIHKQMVVMIDNDLYYLNNVFDRNDDGTMELLGDSILSTIKFHK